VPERYTYVGTSARRSETAPAPMMGLIKIDHSSEQVRACELRGKPAPPSSHNPLRAGVGDSLTMRWVERSGCKSAILRTPNFDLMRAR
jgi:hypothetical protein